MSIRKKKNYNHCYFYWTITQTSGFESPELHGMAEGQLATPMLATFDSRRSSATSNISNDMKLDFESKIPKLRPKISESSSNDSNKSIDSVKSPPPKSKIPVKTSRSGSKEQDQILLDNKLTSETSADILDLKIPDLPDEPLLSDSLANSSHDASPEISEKSLIEIATVKTDLTSRQFDESKEATAISPDSLSNLVTESVLPDSIQAQRPLDPQEKPESWKTMSSSGEASLPVEMWGNQYSVDFSPLSGNEDAYTKTGSSSRQDIISDTDSDGSPQRRRKRSPGKRRAVGSSSGSDVAVHEGAELSPMDDDQGIDKSQQPEFTSFRY